MVGVEVVVECVGVNKMSLYCQFLLKDELIFVYLEWMDVCFFEWFDMSVVKYLGQLKVQLIQYFVDFVECVM